MKIDKQLSASERTSRRRFTKTIAAAIVAAPLVSSINRAQTPAPKQAPAPPNPQPTPAQQPPTPSPLAEAYATVARVRFGDKLTPEELERVKRDLEGNVRTTERLRAVKLQNADEPDFVFIA
ncbi:MAG: hypothetical protein ACR2GW_05755 [Pyrinomonadaceae bacterium]|nr:hypothetical protein [Pyrinomonadaceae bacterium]MDQ3584420.1 hypothetical protein [Acidobacteriota bacterium]